MNTLENVSISTRTLLPEHLLHNFGTFLCDISTSEADQILCTKALKTSKELGNCTAFYFTDQGRHMNLQHDAYELLETLMDALNTFAPEGFYFGAHPGDGSDFGFWQIEDDF